MKIYALAHIGTKKIASDHWGRRILFTSKEEAEKALKNHRNQENFIVVETKLKGTKNRGDLNNISYS